MPVRFGIAISQQHVEDIRKQAETFAAEITDPATGAINGQLIERGRWNELVHDLHIACFRAAVEALQEKDPALGNWRHVHTKTFEHTQEILTHTLEIASGVADMPWAVGILGLPDPDAVTPEDFTGLIMKAIERDYEPAAEAIFTEIKYAELFSAEDAAAARKKAEEAAQRMKEGIEKIDRKYHGAKTGEGFLSPEEKDMYHLQLVDSLYLLTRKAALEKKFPSPPEPEPKIEAVPEKPKPRRHLHLVRR